MCTRLGAHRHPKVYAHPKWQQAVSTSTFPWTSRSSFEIREAVPKAARKIEVCVFMEPPRSPVDTHTVLTQPWSPGHHPSPRVVMDRSVQRGADTSKSSTPQTHRSTRDNRGGPKESSASRPHGPVVGGTRRAACHVHGRLVVPARWLIIHRRARDGQDTGRGAHEQRHASILQAGYRSLSLFPPSRALRFLRLDGQRAPVDTLFQPCPQPVTRCGCGRQWPTTAPPTPA